MDRSTYRRCPLCSGTMAHRFTAADSARPECSEEYAVVWCDRCDFGQIAQAFNPDQIAEFYRIPYYTRSEAKDEPIRSFAERAIIHLAWRCDRGTDFDPSDFHGSTICDIGCGGGNNMRRLRDAGFKVYGVDPDPIALDMASFYGPSLLGSAENLPHEIRSMKFDGVLMMHSLEHCIDPKRALENVRDILAPNGTAIIEVPNSACGLHRYKDKWPYSDVPRHLSFFTPKSLSSMAEAAGFSVQSVKFTGYVRQFYKGWLDKIGRPGPLHLLETCWLPDEQKYDSFRLHLTA